MLKVLDLFSGIGGFSLGLERTGLYETSAFCEWDTECQKVLKKHWPETEVFSDISDLVGYDKYVTYTYYTSGAKDGLYDLKVGRPVDVITGGFPCQDISNSGTKIGIDGPRSGYWREFSRLINEIKPKGVIIENVSALQHRGLGRVLSDLCKIGYDAEWHCIPASHLGAVHKRDRIWVIAYPSNIGSQGSWEPIKPFSPAEIRDRETGIVKYALQRSALPYVCGDHDGVQFGVDRLKQLGNSVYVPVVEYLGKHLYNNLKRCEVLHETT